MLASGAEAAAHSTSTAASFERDERAESCCDHQYWHHRELQHVRPADRRLGHARSNAAFEVQLLMKTPEHFCVYPLPDGRGSVTEPPCVSMRVDVKGSRKRRQECRRGTPGGARHKKRVTLMV